MSHLHHGESANPNGDTFMSAKRDKSAYLQELSSRLVDLGNIVLGQLQSQQNLIVAEAVNRTRKYQDIPEAFEKNNGSMRSKLERLDIPYQNAHFDIQNRVVGLSLRPYALETQTPPPATRLLLNVIRQMETELRKPLLQQTADLRAYYQKYQNEPLRTAMSNDLVMMIDNLQTYLDVFAMTTYGARTDEELLHFLHVATDSQSTVLPEKYQQFDSLIAAIAGRNAFSVLASLRSEGVVPELFVDHAHSQLNSKFLDEGPMIEKDNYHGGCPARFLPVLTQWGQLIVETLEKAQQLQEQEKQWPVHRKALRWARESLMGI